MKQFSHQLIISGNADPCEFNVTINAIEPGYDKESATTTTTFTGTPDIKRSSNAKSRMRLVAHLSSRYDYPVAFVRPMPILGIPKMNTIPIMKYTNVEYAISSAGI